MVSHVIFVIATAIVRVENFQIKIEVIFVFTLHQIHLLVEEEHISIESCVEHDLIRMRTPRLVSLSLRFLIFVTG